MGVLVWIVAQVSVTPTSAGMPGAALANTLLNWLAQLALWGSLASILGGAAVWGVSQHMGYAPGASKGRTLALAGMVGSVLAGLAPTIVNLLFSASRAA